MDRRSIAKATLPGIMVSLKAAWRAAGSAPRVEERVRAAVRGQRGQSVSTDVQLDRLLAASATEYAVSGTYGADRKVRRRL